METPQKQVIEEFKTPMNETAEALAKAVMQDLDNMGIKDQMVRARVLSRSKNWAIKVYTLSVQGQKQD